MFRHVTLLAAAALVPGVSANAQDRTAAIDSIFSFATSTTPVSRKAPSASRTTVQWSWTEPTGWRTSNATFH